MTITRRRAMQGAVVMGAALVCEPVAAVIVPTQACGCPRIHSIRYGHTCTIHDETGKRWDAYSCDEIADATGSAIEPTKYTNSCYCDLCDGKEWPAGTLMFFERVNYEYDEWECYCAPGFKDRWLSQISIDWIAVAKEQGFA